MKTYRILCALIALAAVSCGTQHKIKNIRSGNVQTSLVLPSSRYPSFRDISDMESENPADTLRIVDFEGRETLIMNAVRDEDGEMVATDKLTAALVTARFRNVAERHGKVDLEFQVRVPEAMQDSKWQLRLTPDMYVLGDSLRLAPVIITGRDYRKAQLRGYQQYQRFLDSIITDSTLFINRGALEIFLERNIPEVYYFRNDTSFVSDEQFASAYGVTQQEAVEHYTMQLLKRWNKRKSERRELMFRRYVKSPIISEGIRLDTVIQSANGDFIYNYVQTLNTRPGLRKAEIVLSGGIWEQDNRLFEIPRSEALSFYISSISGLADNTERYLERIIERRVEANTACYIEFPKGKAVIVPDLGNNQTEIGCIKANIRDLLANERFGMDSISVVAFASPEGLKKANEALTGRRAVAASEFFASYAKALRDSISREKGVMLSLGAAADELEEKADITVHGRSGGENWNMLNALVQSDKQLGAAAKESYNELVARIKDADELECQLSLQPYYGYLREHLYPRLRVVKFNFYLHRKGMQKDTVHTTELDTVYMRGVQCLRDHDYEGALKLLGSYSDYNTAVALTALDRNVSAMQILSGIRSDARVDYLKAILYSRKGDDKSAVQCYMHSCAQDPAFIHRGNLDPEISALICKYELNLGN